MKIIAFITEGAVIREILGHLGEPTSPPRVMPARGPPLWEMPGSDPDEGDPQAQSEPDYEFRPAHRVVEGQEEPTRSSGATRASGIDNGSAGPGSAGFFRILRTNSQIDYPRKAQDTVKVPLKFLSFGPTALQENRRAKSDR